MKITLAFQVFNKEKTIKSVLNSWINTLSFDHEYEFIIVFDACKDDSKKIAELLLKRKKITYKFFYADDKYEIYCNNLALSQATGDIIVFIQDDNWMYTKNWDATILKFYLSHNKVGMIGLLAGVKFLSPNTSILHRLLYRGYPENINYERVAVKRKHDAVLKSNNRPVNIQEVDVAIRPFAINTKLLRKIGGLDTKYSPSCGDDMDLGLKLLKVNYANYYISFHVINTSASTKTLHSDYIKNLYLNAYRTIDKQHGIYLLYLSLKKYLKL